MHHPNNPFNKRRAWLGLLVGILCGGHVEAVQPLAEFVHGDRDDLAQIVIPDEGHANTGVLEGQTMLATKTKEVYNKTYLARFGINHGENGLQPLKALADIGVKGDSYSHSDGEVEHHVQVEHILWVDAGEEEVEKVGLAAGFDPL